MAKQTWVNISGTWRKVVSAWSNVNGTWKKDVMPKGIVSGSWKEFMQYVLSYVTRVWEEDAMRSGHEDVIVDGLSNVYVITDYGTYIQKYDPNGSLVWSVLSNDVYGIAGDDFSSLAEHKSAPSNYFYVGGESGAFRIDATSGSSVNENTDSSYLDVTEIIQDPVSNDVFVATFRSSSTRIERWNEDFSSSVWFRNLSHSDMITSMHYDDINDLLFLGDNGGRLTKINAGNGGIAWEEVVGSSVFGVASDANGNSYCLISSDDIIQKDTDGNTISTTDMSSLNPYGMEGKMESGSLYLYVNGFNNGIDKLDEELNIVWRNVGLSDADTECLYISDNYEIAVGSYYTAQKVGLLEQY
ncbi:ligand-binding sensor domain-containing protein [Salimicrobium halophilum]|uniref:PQQ-like domain-containing protein n=1 Tax=Salimicrobium halophilum TaxID=86666 RepID=A0A1G8WCL5_9BACI|nr:hypothetical protein [Salimicrobium halophilum]SDJ76059.1 hypothetical protein SAMN04490247_3119 [Salimicrobium halophilum]